MYGYTVVPIAYVHLHLLTNCTYAGNVWLHMTDCPRQKRETDSHKKACICSACNKLCNYHSVDIDTVLKFLIVPSSLSKTTNWNISQVLTQNGMTLEIESINRSQIAEFIIGSIVHRVFHCTFLHSFKYILIVQDRKITLIVQTFQQTLDISNK